MHIVYLIKSQLKLLFNDRFAIFIIILAPLLLTFLVSYSSNSNNKTDVYFADEDNTKASSQLIDMLKKEKDLNFIHSTESEIKHKVDNNNITVGVVIHKGFERNLENDKSLDITLVENYDSIDTEKLSQIIISKENILQKVNIDSKVISKVLGTNKEKVSKEIMEQISDDNSIALSCQNIIAGQNSEDKATKSLIGFLLMFLWFVAVQGFRTLVEEKENNTFSRIKGMPIKYWKYLLSKIVANYIYGMIIIAIILLAGKYAFHAKIVNHIVPEVILLAVYFFAIVGVVMIFVPFVKKHQTFTIIGSVLMALTGILGGSFFSMAELELPKAIQIASKIMPETWGIKSLEAVIFYNEPLGAQMNTILILCSAGIVGFLISIIVLRISMKTEKIFCK